MSKLYPFRLPPMRPIARRVLHIPVLRRILFFLKACEVIGNFWGKFVMLFSAITYSLLISLPCTLCAALVPRLDSFPPSTGGVFPPSSGESIPFNTTQIGPITFFYRGYLIHNCGTPHDASSQANQVLRFVFKLQAILQNVIADTQQGTRSRHGFAAFFKSNSNIPNVENALRSVLIGRPIIISAERAASDQGPRNRRPTLMCINEDDEKTAHILADCKEIGTGPLAIWPGTEVMALCPDAFNESLHPYAMRTCPTLNRSGKFKPGDASLAHGFFAQLVYNLITMYHRKMYETYEDWDSLKDMQYAVELNARQSLLNIESYGYYVGGKLARTVPSSRCWEL